MYINIYNTIYDIRYTIYDIRYTLYVIRYTIYEIRNTICGVPTGLVSGAPARPARRAADQGGERVRVHPPSSLSGHPCWNTRMSTLNAFVIIPATKASIKELLL